MTGKKYKMGSVWRTFFVIFATFALTLLSGCSLLWMDAGEQTSETKSSAEPAADSQRAPATASDTNTLTRQLNIPPSDNKPSLPAQPPSTLPGTGPVTPPGTDIAALEHKPLSVEAARNLYRARDLWKPGKACSDPDLALALLDIVISEGTDNAESFRLRGMALSELGYGEEAFDDLTIAIQLKPEAQAYIQRGIALLRQGNDTGARLDLDRALELDPNSAMAWNYSGVARLRGDDEAGACADFARGCELGDCNFLRNAEKEKMCLKRRQ